MRIRNAGRSGLNHREFAAAIRSGQAAALIASLEQSVGLALDSAPGQASRYQGFLPRLVVDTYNDSGTVNGAAFGNFDAAAFDAQPELVTVSNAGIPAFLSSYLDPNLIEVILSPMKAAEIAGETKKGDWVTNTAIFMVIESDGEVSAYGDYNNGGNADFNTNFPQRQSFHYQTVTQWGEKELAYQGLAGIDAASRKNVASVMVLNKFQNSSYFYGISGLQNYGLLNDPNLLPPIVPSTAWVGATTEQCFQNVLDLFQQLVSQGNGWIDMNTPMTLAMSTMRNVAFSRTNQFGLQVFDMVKKAFPNITIKTAPEYSTASGELMQLMVDEFQNQETMTAAFTEKLRAHAMVVNMSSFKQKKSQGTWGTVIFRPALIAQALG